MGLVEDIQAEIETRGLLRGGWASGNGSRASIETTCYGLMALRNRHGSARDNAKDFLLRSRNRDGSWPAFDGDDGEGCWTTALALIALRYTKSRHPEVDKSLSWLLESKGQESHWFWKWKFKTVDRAVQFNPDKFGWPWFPGTVSWVIPTAFAVIALRQCRTDEIASRVQVAKEMLAIEHAPKVVGTPAMESSSALR